MMEGELKRNGLPTSQLLDADQCYSPCHSRELNYLASPILGKLLHLVKETEEAAVEAEEEWNR